MFTCRDGVSESQFNQVLNIELDQMMQVWLLWFVYLFRVCCWTFMDLVYFLGVRHASLLKKIGNPSSQ